MISERGDLLGGWGCKVYKLSTKGTRADVSPGKCYKPKLLGNSSAVSSAVRCSWSSLRQRPHDSLKREKRHRIGRECPQKGTPANIRVIHPPDTPRQAPAHQRRGGALVEPTHALAVEVSSVRIGVLPGRCAPGGTGGTDAKTGAAQ